MALDINALKNKLNSFKRSGGDRDTSIWKPKEGKAVIRIVPWKGNASNPFVELYFHYLGNKTYLSPLSYGNRDPIAEFADALRSDQSRDPKERYAEARPFMPKLRTYIPVIVRGEEDKGVRFFSFGKTVHQELLSYIVDPDYGDITDVKSGRDIVVEHIPQEKSDTNFSKTSIKVKPAQTPLSTDDSLVKKWLEEQPDLKELYTEPSYNELKVVLEKYLDPDNSVITPAREAEQPKSVTAQAAAPKEAAKEAAKNAVDAFDELFNED
jgi:hypothetical protein